MPTLSEQLHLELNRLGAPLAGFASLEPIPAELRCGLPIGVSIALPCREDILLGIDQGPTQDYYNHYKELNQRLDALAQACACFLEGAGYRAMAQTTAFVAQDDTDYTSRLPHKTVATRAGLGFIGKCALLITEPYGSAVRLTSVLTDAPLEPAEPITASRCGSCMNCAEACPGGAVSGRNWQAGMEREAFYDAYRCRRTARALSAEHLHRETSQCGKCILVCPYTQRYLRNAL